MKWYLCRECGNVWDAEDNTCPACGNHKNVWDITNMPEYRYLIERAEQARAARKQPAGVKLIDELTEVIDDHYFICEQCAEPFGTADDPDVEGDWDCFVGSDGNVYHSGCCVEAGKQVTG